MKLQSEVAYRLNAGGPPGKGPGSGHYDHKHLSKELSYREYKKLRNSDFRSNFYSEDAAVDAFKRLNPKESHWLVHSFGASFHDPQLMALFVSGKEPPAGVKPIRNVNDLHLAWEALRQEEIGLWKVSRKFYNT